MSEPGTPRRIEVRDGEEVVVQAEVASQPDQGTVRASLRTDSPHIPPGRRADLVDAVMDAPEVRDGTRLEAAVPLGDTESLERLRPIGRPVPEHFPHLFGRGVDHYGELMNLHEGRT